MILKDDFHKISESHVEDNGFYHNLTDFNNNSEVILRSIIRDRNEQTTVDMKATKCTICFVNRCAWVVKKAPNLVLDLKMISVVSSRGNWAVGSKHTLLPRILPLLDAAPAKNSIKI